MFKQKDEVVKTLAALTRKVTAMINKSMMIGLVTILAITLLPLFAQAQSPIKLECSADEDSYVFDVDIASSTVNGHSAQIDKDTIEWVEQPTGSDGPSISYYINRHTGQFVIGKKFNPKTDMVGRLSRNKAGMCRKAGNSQF